MRKRVSIAVAGIGSVALIAVAPAVLSAHAKLVRSEPKADAVLAAPPQVVRMWFDDELDPRRSTLTVWDPRGGQVDDGRGGVDLDDLDRRSMAARLKPVGRGRYTVRWRAVSADDGNVALGTFEFTVNR